MAIWQSQEKWETVRQRQHSQREIMKIVSLGRPREKPTKLPPQNPRSKEHTKTSILQILTLEISLADRHDPQILTLMISLTNRHVVWCALHNTSDFFNDGRLYSARQFWERVRPLSLHNFFSENCSCGTILKTSLFRNLWKRHLDNLLVDPLHVFLWESSDLSCWHQESSVESHFAWFQSMQRQDLLPLIQSYVCPHPPENPLLPSLDMLLLTPMHKNHVVCELRAVLSALVVYSSCKVKQVPQNVSFQKKKLSSDSRLLLLHVCSIQ